MKMNEKKLNWLVSIGINVMALAILLLCFFPSYEMNDDGEMSIIVNGLYGEYDSHTMFSNIILSKIIVFLNNVIIMINWYTVLQYLVIFVSFLAVTYVLVKEKGTVIGGTIAGFLTLTFGYQFYVQPQFTKTAGLAALAGGILVFFMTKVSDRKKKILYVVSGVALMLIGYMYRKTAFRMSFLMLVPIGIVLLLMALKENWKQAIREYVPVVVIFALVYLLGMGLAEIHSNIYKADEEWKAYLKRRNYEVDLLDGFIPYYEDVPQLYEALGLSAEDRAFYEAWNNADVEKFDTETLRIMAEAKEGYWVDPKTKMTSFLPKVIENMPEISVFPYVMLLILFLVLSGGVETWLIVLAELGFTMGAYAYMYMVKERIFYNRVDVPLFFCIAVGIAFLWKPRQKMIQILKKGQKFWMPAAMLLTLVWVIGENEEMLRTNYDTTGMEKNGAFIEKMSADKEHLYLSTNGTVSTAYAWGIFERKPKGYLSNYYEMGGWQVYSPTTNAVLRRYGVENIYRDAIDNDSVYIVDKHGIEPTEAYVQRNYDENAYMELVDEWEGFKIYRLRSK